MTSYSISTHLVDDSKPDGLVRAVLFEFTPVADRNVPCRCVANVYEAGDIRTLALFVEEHVGHLNPGVEMHFDGGRIEYPDCLSLAEAIEAEFVSRPAREAEEE